MHFLGMPYIEFGHVRRLTPCSPLFGAARAGSIVLAAEKKITSKLLETAKTAEKMYRIDEHVAWPVAGLTADANILINDCRVASQRYRFTYQMPMPVEQLVQSICDRKQGYTQYGGLRPFGVSFLFAGWDEHHGFQLYQSDPSGNFGGWKAMAIGANAQSSQSILKQDYDAEMDLEAATKLAIKVLAKTMDSTTLNHEKVEIATLSRDGDGDVCYHMLGTGETDKALKEHQEAEAAAAQA